MAAIQLQTLRADCRLYADQRDSEFLSDAEINRLINRQIRELYDVMVEVGGHEHFADDTTISIVAGTAGYNLAADFYQLEAVQLEWDTDDTEPVDALNHQAEIWKFTNYTESWDRWTPKAYRITGGQIVFYPTPAAAVTCRYYYVPTFTDLSLDTDTFDFVNGWEEMVLCGVAATMKDIEEEGSGRFMRERFQEQRERIQGMADDRDASQDVQVRDVRRRRVWYPSATGHTQ